MLKRIALGLALGVLVTACEQEAPPSGECVADPDEQSLYPLQPGAWWRHEVTDPDTNVRECSDKLVYVEALQQIPLRPEVTAYRVVRRSNEDIGVRWQEVRDDGEIVRHVDEWFTLQMQRSKIAYYCPWQLRTTSRVEAGFTEEAVVAQIVAVTPEDWSQCEAIAIDSQTCMPTTSYEPTKCIVTVSPQTSTWTAVEVAESLTVPAGEFSDLVAWEIADAGESTKTFTWARGLGKLLEVGTQREVLVDCCLPSTDCTRPAPTALELDNCQ